MRIIILAVTKLFRLLPERMAISIGLFFSWVLHRIIKFRYKIIHNQLTVVYGKKKSSEEIDCLIGAIYRHLGLMAVELLRLPGISKKEIQEKTIFHGNDIAKKAIAKGKGVIALMGHIGNWELMGPAWVQQGYKISAIGKEMKSGPGNIFISLIRDDNGVTTIPRSNSLKDILRILEDNGIVAVMIDQNMTANEGLFVDFFGYQACTLPGLAVLAARSGAVVLPTYCYRDTDLKHHHIVVLPEVPLETGLTNTRLKIIHNTERFTKVLESIIEKHPEQWLWIHKRWKTRPKEERLSPFRYK